MASPLEELGRQVSLLQRGSPQEVKDASARLSQFQRSRHALTLSVALLRAAQGSGEAFASFFAAQSLAARARLCAEEDSEIWPQVAPELLEVLSSGSCGKPALRQLCVALSRSFVAMCDTWPNALPAAMTQLGDKGDLLPLLEFLQALAEEPFSRRLLVDGSRRSRFLLALRDRQPVILAALVEAVRRSANEATLSAAAAWLRAQSLYEEWLPMIGIDAPGRGVHSALTTLSPIFQGEVLRVAKLEFGLPALEACAALVAAALPLVGSAFVPETDPRRLPDRILGPLLASLGELCRGLPSVPHAGVQTTDAADVAGVLLTVLHSAFSLPLTLCSESLLRVLTEMGVRLLVVTGPRGGVEVDVEGGLLGRAFDAWEVLANGLRSEPSSAALDLAAATAYAQLLYALPVALKLPLNLPADQGPKAATWGVRGRIAQVLTVWCSGAPQRQGEAVAKLRELQVQSGSALDAAGLADLEMVLTFGSAVAEMCASTAEMESELPVPRRSDWM
ncbi:unnamed protein product [Symbiodinium sp. CCMP2592]|nr:unnamed protein product [Symbiodinium sp. CCMP2592]